MIRTHVSNVLIVPIKMTNIVNMPTRNKLTFLLIFKAALLKTPYINHQQHLYLPKGALVRVHCPATLTRKATSRQSPYRRVQLSETGPGLDQRTQISEIAVPELSISASVTLAVI